MLRRILDERFAVLILLFLLAAALFASTLGKEYQVSAGLQDPQLFPRIILLLWLVLNGLLLVEHCWLRDDRLPGTASSVRLIVMVVAVLAYLLLIKPVGFFIASASFVAVALPAFGIKKPLVVALFAMLVPGVLVVLFNHSLHMPLPTSPFTYWF